MLKLARAAGVLIGVLVALYLVDLTLLSWWTSDPLIVRPEAIAPADTPADTAVEDDSSLSSQTEAQERLFQTRAYDGLAVWAVATTGLAGLVILAWYAVAFVKERTTYGPASQPSAWPYWWLLVAGYGLGSLALFFWLIAPMDLGRYILDLQIYLAAGLVFVLGLVAIWIASVAGIGPVLRPSVLAGARFS